MTTLLILGLGYCAERFLALHRPAAASATVRSAAAAAKAESMGVSAVRVETGFGADFEAAVDAADVLLASAPPDAAGDPFVAVVAAALDRQGGRPQMIYLSTIGVYGDHAGAWVDETTPTAPLSPRGRERVLAEAQWQALGQQRGAPVAVLRLPGIYGPGRSAFDSLRAGQARRIVKPGQVFNRVHVDDIAGGIAAAITCRADGVFNITDDLPSPPQDVIAHAAALLGMPPPPEVAFEDANLTPMARSFYSECKRAANGRAKLVLGWQPRYPSYREGLAAILAAGG